MIKTNENGRSMIEMLGVLAIIGVLSVGGITAFGTMFNRYKINETQIQANAIAAKISAYGSESASYDGLTNVAAIKMGAVPSKAVADADKGELTNLYRGSITISGAPLFNKSTDTTLLVTGFSNASCNPSESATDELLFKSTISLPLFINVSSIYAIQIYEFLSSIAEIAIFFPVKPKTTFPKLLLGTFSL